MAVGKVLYAQVLVIRHKYLEFTEANKNEARFKFQGQSARSQSWFYLDLDWIKVNFSTSEPDFYRKLFQSHENTQDTNTFKIFQVPIGNSKCVEISNFYSDVPMLKYRQKLFNSCCFSSLASAFASIKQTKADNYILLFIEEYLNSKVDNCIYFENSILKNEKT